MLRLIKNYVKKTRDLIFFCQDYLNFTSRSDARFSTKLIDLQLCLGEKNKLQSFDAHYLYHPAWAARIIAHTKPDKHVDIASILNFSTLVSAFVPVDYYDYRPANLHLSNLSSGHCDLTRLDFADESLASLSCMHTVEHIGLGRYGDPIDPSGDLKAIGELKRVVKPGGDLLFVVPVGRPKIKFNANRIYSYAAIIDYFSGFRLQDFSLILDNGQFINQADSDLVKDQVGGCGCFWFKKLS